MITNLINSSGDAPDKGLEYKWLEEYWHGKGFEIYKTALSPWFNGKTFSKCARLVYRNFNAILFAIDIPLDKENSYICINPGKYKLPMKSESVGYIIAEDKEVADQVKECGKSLVTEEPIGKPNVGDESEILKEDPTFFEKNGGGSKTGYTAKPQDILKTTKDAKDFSHKSENNNIHFTKHIIEEKKPIEVEQELSMSEEENEEDMTDGEKNNRQ